MNVTIVIGRAGSGKTERCLDEIRSRLREQPDGHPLVLLVPEQATFQAEYALVSSPGIAGMLRAQVLSFRRLAYRIMQETGGAAKVPIQDTGKKLLLFALLQERRDRLSSFRASIDTPGFLDKLQELFAELKRYGWSPDESAAEAESRFAELGKASGSRDFSRKMSELLALYRDYERLIAQRYIDSEDVLNRLTEQAERSEFLREADVWMDGFNGFTPQEYAAVAKLMRHARSLTITLTLDRAYAPGERPHELDLFHPTAVTFVKLLELVESAGARMKLIDLNAGGEVPARFRDVPALAHVERAYHRRSAWNGPEDAFDGLSVWAAPNRRAEVEAVARQMLSLVRDGGCRWRDVAILVRNPADYGELLQNVLADYEIPSFFDEKRTVMHHPLVELIRSALEVAAGGWRYDAVFRYLKTDLPAGAWTSTASSGASGAAPGSAEQRRAYRKAIDELENYVLAFGIQGSSWTNGKPWTYRMLRSLEEEDAGPAEQGSIRLERINRTRERVAAPLKQFERKLAKAATAAEQAAVVYELLEALDVPKQLEQWSAEAESQGQLLKAKEHVQIWGQVMDLLDQLVETLGEERLTPEQLSAIVEAGLESIRLGLVPPALDQVLVGSLERTRFGHVRHCFLLGVNDGVLPAKPQEDGLLTEEERARLLAEGFELAPDSRRRLLDEQFLIYSALTVPSRKLWISYAMADEEGRALLPSEIVRRLKTMFPMLAVRELHAEPELGTDSRDQLAFVSHPRRTVSRLLVQLRLWSGGAAIDPLWWRVYDRLAADPAWRGLMKPVLYGLFFTNKVQPLSPETSKLLYGEELRASVSRLETFVACPFSHFASYGLRLRERSLYRLEAPDIGQLFHAALSQIAKRLLEEGQSWGALTDADCRRRAEAAVERLLPRLQSEILFSSKRYAYIARKLRDIVSRTTIVLSEHARRGEFQPVGLELDFGPGGALPPLSFELSGGTKMEIAGRIDRIDRADSERGLLLRVIDYKSSPLPLSMAEVYYGLSLQLLTYLDVAVSHAEAWLGRKALPAGALYFHVHNPQLNLANPAPEAAIEDQLFKRFKMRGLLAGDIETIRLMDNKLESGYSEMLPVRVKKDGGFASNSSVMSEKDWRAVRGHVRRNIREAGEALASGVVEAKPYKLGKKSPCGFCAYKPVCQFDPLFEDNDYRSLAAVGKEDAWERIRERHATEEET